MAARAGPRFDFGCPVELEKKGCWLGKVVGLKAKPAKMIVKCYPDAALMKIFQ